MEYPNLEPNHRVDLDDDGYHIVVCPYVDPATGEGFETSWSLNAEPEEVNCLFCEHLKGDYPLHPDHAVGDAETPAQ